MPWNRVTTMAAVLIGVLACRGGGTDPIVVDPGGKPKVDPYATVLIENLLTPAAGARQQTYEIYIVLNDTAFGAGRSTATGAVQPGERTCGALSGYVGQKVAEIVGITDTVQSVFLTPIATRVAASRNEASWTGLYRPTTGLFDPLVSSDTSRGHTRERPVKWRWSLTDAGTVLVEDTTTVCTF